MTARRTSLSPARLPIARAIALVALACLGLAGCLVPLGGVTRGGALRISELTGEGDPTRRASIRLVTQGLVSDSDARPQLALSQYERAIQVDPNNPFAYLAIARHHIDGDDPDRGIEYLEQAEILLDAEGLRSPRVEPHLIGLRGAVLSASGNTADGAKLLRRAGANAPKVWGDARLTAAELR